MAVSVVTWGLLVPLMVPLPYRHRYRILTSWGRFNLWTLRWLCGITVSIEGRLSALGPPGVVLSKHQSTWETLSLLKWFSPQTWVLKRSLLRIPVFGWSLALLEPIAIDRAAGNRARQQVVEQGVDRLSRNRWVVVFPEGTRTRPGHRGRYRSGGAELAIAAGVPVVPVAHNAGSYWPRRSPFKIPGIIRLRIGEPIPTEGRKPGELMDEVERWIERQMAEIQSIPPSDVSDHPSDP